MSETNFEHVPASDCPATLYHVSPAVNGEHIFASGLDPDMTGQNSAPDAGDAVFMWVRLEDAESMINQWESDQDDEGVALYPEWDIWQVDAAGLTLYSDPEFEHLGRTASVYTLKTIPADRLAHLTTIAVNGDLVCD